MLRAVAYLIASVLVISVLRAIIGIVAKAFSDLFHPEAPPQSVPHPPAVPETGELKKDPVCGTFVSVSSPMQKRVGGEVFYFCSQECRDKFRG